MTPSLVQEPGDWRLVGNCQIISLSLYFVE